MPQCRRPSHMHAMSWIRPKLHSRRPYRHSWHRHKLSWIPPPYHHQASFHLQIITNIQKYPLIYQFFHLCSNITNLSSKKDKGEVKTALEICKKDLSTNASTILSEAKTSLKTGDYDKTNKSIKLALGFPLRCMFNLKRVKFTSPQLFSQINIYAQLSDAAMRIIDRF